MSAPTFTPTSAWQDVPADAVLPAGCQIEVDVTTGRQRARRVPDLSANSVVTILEEIGGKPVNKEVLRNPDGSIVKGMAKNSGVFKAQTIAAPDLPTFAGVIADLGANPHKTLMLGEFKGAPDEPFLVLPEELVMKHLKLDPADPESRKAVLGFHEHPHHHMPMVARLKNNTMFGGWLLLDRDAVDGMPEELATLSRDDWLARGQITISRHRSSSGTRTSCCSAAIAR